MSEFTPTMELRFILRRAIVGVGSYRGYSNNEYTSTLQQKWVRQLSSGDTVAEWLDVVSVIESHST